jgi:very-short-patch-repair endonuclease
MRLTRAEYNALLARRTGNSVLHRLTGRRWEDEFAVQMQEARIEFEREYRFLLERRFRFDFALPARKLAVEIDGVVHRIKSRFAADREKGNLATLHGWRVMHFAPAQVRSGDALALLRLALAGELSAIVDTGDTSA